TALLPILAPNVYIMAGVIFIAGLSFAPTMVIVMNLGTLIVPPAKLTEGLTWMTTGISIGVALGGMLAGLVIDAYGARAGFGVAIASGLSMVVLAMIGLPILRAASEMRAELAAEAS
ncbi:MFS transporter, partial [Aeromonas finlandensis]|uniref:MFS transporter n=1 Tax=Aeromonas finlandensis TaxID=1543375 RepID=UPI00051C7010